MKKLFRTLMVLTIASAAVLTSCKKDEDIADVTATVTANPSTSPLTLGTSLKLTIQCTGNDDNKLVNVKLTSNKTTAPLLSKDISGTSANEVVDVILDKTGTWVFTVTLEGKENTTTASYEVTVNGPSSYSPIFGNAAPTPLGAQLNANLGQFIDLSGGTVYKYGDNDSANAINIDLCYASGSANGASLFAPTNSAFVTGASGTVYPRFKNYIVRNATKVGKLTGVTLTEAEFDALTNDSIIVNNLSVLSSSDLANNLSVGSLVIFELAKNPTPYKKGIIYVTSLTPGSNGDIGIKFKITN